MSQQQSSTFHNAFLPSLWRHLGLDALDDSWSMAPSRSGPYSLSEDDSSIYLELPMPGVQASDIEISQDKGVVRISAEAARETPPSGDKERKYYERANYRYAFTFALPERIDDKLEPVASYQNGVLALQFHKISPQQPKKINIKVN